MMGSALRTMFGKEMVVFGSPSIRALFRRSLKVVEA